MLLARRIHDVGKLLLTEVLIVGLIASRTLAAQAPAASNITSDNSLRTTVTQSANVFNIGGGARPGGGTNLFQSFGFFTIAEGDIANFVNTSGLLTNNIISRVTGGQPSSIFGTIQTADFPGANLFLINPSGVIFGPTASLNVGGSFHVSTADYLRFADGAKFFASLGQTSTLSMTAPTAFGFLGASTPAPVTIDGSVLQVPEGQTLSVVGGDIEISGGATLSAPSGRVQIASVASAGEVTIPDFDVSSFSTLGQIGISENSIVDASDMSGIGGGTVVIRGGRLVVDQATIQANNLGDVDGAPTAIDLQAAGDIAFNDGAAALAMAFGAGRGGDISVNAGGALQMQNMSTIQTLTFGDGAAGNISANSGTLLLTGLSKLRTDTFGGGPGGDITVAVQESAVISGHDEFGDASGIFSFTAGGNGGPVSLSAASLTIDDGGFIGSRSFGESSGGDVTVNAGNLTLTGGGSIFTNTQFLGAGGNITVNANSALISGVSTDASPSGIFTNSTDVGASGNIALNVTGAVTVTGGGLIQSGSEFDPQGGNIAITADSLTISNGSGVSSQALIQDVGSIAVNTKTLTIDNGYISTSTLEAGRAGDIELNVGTLSLTNGGQIATSSVNAPGMGGNLSIVATDSVYISGSSPTGSSPLPSPFGDLINDARSGLFSTASGTGNGGQINVSAPNIQMTHGGVISAVSSGTSDALGAAPGNAGSVNIVVGNTLDLSNGTITTAAAEAAGGDITITHTGSLLELTNSQITTSVNGGDGKGGNITIGAVLDPVTLEPQNIIPFDIITLNNSGIHANAFGGPGGNINIFADVFLSSEPISTAVTASSALSTPGIIDIHAQITDVSSEVTPLPEAPLQAAVLLRASCSVRLAEGKSSSLVLAGREGLPLEPGGLLPSPLFNGSEKIIGFNSSPRGSTSETGFSLLGSAKPTQALAWEQFQLAKAALGFGCAP